MKKISCFLAVGLLVSLGVCAPASETPASPTLSILKSVPLAELPGKAAALVAAANAKVQAQTTVDVVKAAVGLNPAAAPAIGAFAQALATLAHGGVFAGGLGAGATSFAALPRLAVPSHAAQA